MSQTAEELLLLYELSLNLGQSMQPEETCRRFLRTLLSRCKLYAASIWWRETGEADLAPADERVEFRLLDAIPRGQYPNPCQSIGQAQLQLLQTDQVSVIQANTAGTEAFSVFASDAKVMFGTLAIFPLGQDGLLLLESVDTATLTPPFLARLRAVVSNLTNSIRGSKAFAMLQSRTDELDAARSLLQAVIDTVPIRVFWKDRDSRYLGCNPAFARDAGMLSPAELLGKDDFEMSWAQQAELHRADDRRIMETQEARIGSEAPQTMPDGRQIWLRTSKVPLSDRQGQVMGVLGVYEDISASKQTEMALQLSEERFDLAMRGANDGLWDWNMVTQAVYFSPRWKSMLGYADDELENAFSTWELLVDDVGRAVTMMLIEDCVSGRANGFLSEFRMRHKDGHWVDILSRSTVLRDAAGQPLRMVGTHVDISLQKQAKQVLVDHSRRLEEAVNQRTATLEQRRMALLHNQNVLTRLLQSPILTQSPLLEAFPYITEILAEHLGVARVSIWQRTHDGEAITCTDLFEALVRRHSAGMILHRKEYPAYFEALNLNTVIDAEDASTHSATAPFSSVYLKPLCIVSMLDVPVFVHGRNWGVICCEHIGQRRTWIAEEIAFVIAVVALVALTVEAEEHRSTMLALEKSKDAAEAANRAKSAFLANMSHELRTPMHGMMGMIDLAKRRIVDPRALDQLDKAKRSAERLLGVLNDILDLSKIEADRLVLDDRPLQLADTIDQLQATLDFKAAEKGLRLIIDIAADLAQVQLAADPLRLGQVLVNMAGNAIKFTDRGEVTVRVRQVAETAEILRVRFDVIDTGIGIDAEAKTRLFQSFEQADNSVTRKYGGTGLGLAICKQLVRMMGGEIGVESVLGQGSTFWFSVPLKKRAPSLVTPEPISAVFMAERRLQSEYAGTRILLVDDEPINQEVSRDLLEYVGLKIDLAADGRQALELAQRNHYALILMDMQMPVMSGTEATQAIRVDSLNRDTPILAMTANAAAADRAVCLAAGMNEHIAKPINPRQLFETTLAWLEKGKG